MVKQAQDPTIAMTQKLIGQQPARSIHKPEDAKRDKNEKENKNKD